VSEQVKSSKAESEYCCVWCHRALPANKTYATESGQTTCVNCRGIGIVLNKWNKPCKRRHSVDAGERGEEGE
jgi:hypothetical protein